MNDGELEQRLRRALRRTAEAAMNDTNPVAVFAGRSANSSLGRRRWPALVAAVMAMILVGVLGAVIVARGSHDREGIPHRLRSVRPGARTLRRSTQ